MGKLFLTRVGLIAIAFLFSQQGFSQETASIYFKNSSDYVMKVLKNYENRTQGELLMNSSNEKNENLPQSILQAADLFKKSCVDSKLGNKTVTTRKMEADYSQLNFVCDVQDETLSQHHSYQFLFTLENEKSLLDLQVLDVSGNQDELRNKQRLTFKDSAEIALTVGLSTLASGLLAKQAYPGQEDKYKHVIIGNLIGSVTTLLAFYGFKMDENKSALIGFSTALLVGVLKEVLYDRYHQDKHTVDRNDAIATALGGAVGSVAIRIKFVF